MSPKGTDGWQLRVPTSLQPAPPAVYLPLVSPRFTPGPGPRGSAMRKSFHLGQYGGGSVVGFRSLILNEGCFPEVCFKVTSPPERDFSSSLPLEQSRLVCGAWERGFL